MSALLDLTCGCEACGTRWEITAFGCLPDEGGLIDILSPECPQCASDTYTIIISVNNDFEPAARHESLTPGERNR